MKGIKNVRLKNYDYQSDGFYFVTIVSKLRQDLFDGKEKLVEDQLSDLARQTTGFAIDYFVVMPDHVHMILVLEDCSLPLGEIVRRFKAKVSHALGKNAWQPSYYDHVIRDERALNKIREYIVNNPQAELLKFEQFYSEPINRRATDTGLERKTKFD